MDSSYKILCLVYWDYRPSTIEGQIPPPSSYMWSSKNICHKPLQVVFTLWLNKNLSPKFQQYGFPLQALMLSPKLQQVIFPPPNSHVWLSENIGLPWYTHFSTSRWLMAPFPPRSKDSTLMVGKRTFSSWLMNYYQRHYDINNIRHFFYQSTTSKIYEPFEMLIQV